MIPLAIILGLVLITVMIVISVYNKLILFRNRKDEAWSGIDVFLKKRHDLVPNLVSIVKAYATHESQTFEDITRCRAAAMQAREQGARIESEAGLGKAIGRLMVVAEKYPNLKANINFLELQNELSRIEDDLSLSRRYYNGTVRELNIKIESFPSNIIAGMFRFEKGTFFEINKSERIIPDATF